MAGYPNLHPAGFVEFQEPCAGPSLYRGQPSRETRGVTLNEFMEKYNPSGRITDYKFMETLRDVKEFSRNWDKIPKRVQEDVLKLLKSSDNALAEELKPKAPTENYTDKLRMAKNTSEAKSVVNDMIEHFGAESDITCVDNRLEAFRLTLVAVLSIVVAFIIFMASRATPNG